MDFETTSASRWTSFLLLNSPMNFNKRFDASTTDIDDDFVDNGNSVVRGGFRFVVVVVGVGGFLRERLAGEGDVNDVAVGVMIVGTSFLVEGVKVK